jgi:hypothetical protein
MAGFTQDDMDRFATEAWGPLGGAIVAQWAAFNRRYFAGRLRPVPLVLTNAQPFGKRLAFCSYSPAGFGRTITLNVPKDHDVLLADNNALLHEMIHQLLNERGEPAGHDSAGWRREIMRLHSELTGRAIWAGRSRVIRENGKVVRRNALSETGEPSLTQMQIACWPAGTGIALGALGGADRTEGAHHMQLRDFYDYEIDVLVPNNPRQEETHGHHAFNLYRKGMTVRAYLAASFDQSLPIRHGKRFHSFTGPHRRHLEWDIEHGFVRLIKPASLAA